MRSELRVITWEEAKIILERHTNVRTLRASVVDRYLRDMLSGAWIECSAQGLIFDADDILVDGQHRLAAQVRAKMTLTWYVTYGGEANGGIDRGRPRTVADVLHGREASGRQRVAIARSLGVIVWGLWNPTAHEITLLQQMYGGRWFDAAAAHRGWPNGAPFRAAVVYASPGNLKPETFFQGLRAEDLTSRNLELLRGLASKSARRGDAADIFYKTLTALEAIQEGRQLTVAKPNRRAFASCTVAWHHHRAAVWRPEWAAICDARTEREP